MIRNKHRLTVSIISSARDLFTFVDRSYISFESPGSNRIIITLEQQVDVLEELVRDNRAEVNFTLATNGMVLQMTVNSIVHVQ